MKVRSWTYHGPPLISVDPVPGMLSATVIVRNAIVNYVASTGRDIVISYIYPRLPGSCAGHSQNKVR